MTFQTFTPREYLKIDIANNYGLDKLKWRERIAWFDDHEGELLSMIRQAESPALFYAGLQAWEQVKAGEPIGYMISLDATSSGLQILAALTGDRKAAQLCNVIDFGPEAEAERRDGYTVIYDIMVNQIGDTSKIQRDDVKQAIMTSLYGSTAMPKRVFGEKTALLEAFYDTMKDQAPAAWELNQAFLAMWDPEVDCHEWVMPDNFHVKIKVMDTVKDTVNFLNQPFDVFYKQNRPIEQGRSLAANCTHGVDGMIVRELTRRCDYNPEKIISLWQLLETEARTWGTSEATEDDKLVKILWDHYQKTGYLSARILDVLNADNIGHVAGDVIFELLNSLPEKPFKVISVHDCFRCLPTYGNDLRRQYNIQLQLIAQSDLLTSLVSQIIQKPVQSIGKMDPDLYIQIIDTNYALS